MTKFGDLICGNKPVLFHFYVDYDPLNIEIDNLLKEVISEVDSFLTIVQIDLEKNLKLADALNIKSSPVFMVYKNGNMYWKHSGNIDRDTIISISKAYR